MDLSLDKPHINLEDYVHVYVMHDAWSNMHEYRISAIKHVATIISPHDLLQLLFESGQLIKGGIC